jgi:hypothetical protein
MLIGDLVVRDVIYLGVEGSKVEGRIGIILAQVKFTRNETCRKILWSDGSVGEQWGGVRRIALRRPL